MLQRLKQYFTPLNVALLILFLFFFFLLRWNFFTAPFERDEGVYSYSAWIMRKGFMPYEYSFPYKPPMIIYTYYIGQELFGDNVWSPRILAIIFSLLTIFVVGLIARKEAGVKAAWLSVFLLAIMLILPGGYGNRSLADIYYAANTEIFMIFPLILLLMFYRLYGTLASNKIWLLSGVVSALAINYKPICLVIIIYIYFLWLLDIWKQGKNIKLLISRIFTAAMAFAVISFLIYLPFLLSDGGRSVWNGLVNFTSCYAKMNQWNFSLNQILLRFGSWLKYYWFVFILLIYLLLKNIKHRPFYLGLLLVSYLPIYQSLIGHYYIQIMPFVAISAAIALAEMSKEPGLKNRFHLIIFVVFISILWPIKEIFTKNPQELGLWVYGNLDPYYEAEIVGKRMAEVTAPEDYVLTQGDDIEITYFAQRMSTFRFESTSFYADDCDMLTKYRNQGLVDLKERPPAAIVLCITGSCSYIWRDQNARPFMESLTKLINENYILIGGWIPTEKGGYWQEPLKTDEIRSARTLLFKKFN